MILTNWMLPMPVLMPVIPMPVIPMPVIPMPVIPMPVLLPVPNLMNRFRKIHQAGVDVEASGSGPEEEAAVAVKQAA